MDCKLGKKIGLAIIVLVASASMSVLHASSGPAVFNVKDYGATGRKENNAWKAIQAAVEACAKAGGGTVYLPPGDYTSGTIHLRSHVRFLIDSGATLYASKNAAEFDAPSLIYAKDVDNITIDGRGTIDGQAEYVWRLTDHDDAYIRDNQLLAKAAGVPLMRSFPKGDAEHGFFPRMIHLVRCKDVRIAGISILHSPSWNINPYACERMVIDGIYIYSSPKEAVWADGIDPDGCKDLRIMNSTIITGDDALVFYSSNGWGPALPCENITVTNCRLTSASSALKFCDGIQNCVRNVTIDNCVITAANRGVAFMNFSGGYVENVVMSNLVINTQRFDWFWWGNGDPIYFSIRRNPEEEDSRPGTPPAGSIRNVILRNIIAHGQGSCEIRGHRDSPLLNVSLENVKFFLSTDPKAAYDRYFAGVSPSAGGSTPAPVDPAVARAKAEQQAVLNLLKGEMSKIRTTVGTADYQKIDAHLEGLLAIERLNNATTTPTTGGGGAVSCVLPPASADVASASNNGGFPTQVTQMMDIATGLLACDVTRVLTLQISYAFSNVVHSWLGQTKGHHTMCHDGLDERVPLAAIDTWYSQQVAYLLGKLDAVNEGSGTLLDNTLVVWGHENGTTAHNGDNAPFMLAGKAGGALRTGRFLNFPAKTPHAMLLVAVAQLMGLPLTSIGNIKPNSGPLAGII